MRFSRARYVTLCQQSLVTAAVLVVGVSAAGVRPWTSSRRPSPARRARRGAPVGPEATARRPCPPGTASSQADGRHRAGDAEGPRGRGAGRRQSQAEPPASADRAAPPARPRPRDDRRTPPRRPRRPTPSALVALSAPQPGPGLRHRRRHLEARRGRTPRTRSASRSAPRRTAPGRAGRTARVPRRARPGRRRGAEAGPQRPPGHRRPRDRRRRPGADARRDHRRQHARPT